MPIIWKIAIALSLILGMFNAVLLMLLAKSLQDTVVKVNGIVEAKRAARFSEGDDIDEPAAATVVPPLAD